MQWDFLFRKVQNVIMKVISTSTVRTVTEWATSSLFRRGLVMVWSEDGVVVVGGYHVNRGILPMLNDWTLGVCCSAVTIIFKVWIVLYCLYSTQVRIVVRTVVAHVRRDGPLSQVVRVDGVQCSARMGSDRV